MTSTTPRHAKKRTSKIYDEVTINEIIEKATDLMNKNSYDQAVAALSRFITEYPDSIELHLKRCECWIFKEDFHWAQHDIEQCLLIDPENPDVYSLQGDIFKKQKRVYDAYHAWTHACTKDREDVKKKRHELQHSVSSTSLMSMITITIDDELLHALEDPKDLDLLSLPDLHRKLDDCIKILQVDNVALSNHVVSAFFLTHSYNKACCIMAQVVAWFPHHMPLFNWREMVDCLGRCLYQDWDLHGRNAKFCANALTVLAADSQDDVIRRYAIKTLFVPMSLWLVDSTPSPDELEDPDFAVSGCSFVLRRHSAISWLEMLFEQMSSASPGDVHNSAYRLVVEQELLLFPGNLFLFNQLLHIMHSEKIVSLIIPDIVSHVRGFTDVLALPRNKDILLDAVTTFSFFITCADATPLFSSAVCTGLLTILKTRNVSSTLVTSQHASVPLLVVLSRLACSHSQALDLLEYLARSHQGITNSIRALAQVLEVTPEKKEKADSKAESDDHPSTPSSGSTASIDDEDIPEISWDMVLKVNNDNRNVCLLTYCSDHFILEPVIDDDEQTSNVFIPLVTTDEIIPTSSDSSTPCNSTSAPIPHLGSITGILKQDQDSSTYIVVDPDLDSESDPLLKIVLCGSQSTLSANTLCYPVTYVDDVTKCIGKVVKLRMVAKKDWVSEEIYAKTSEDGIAPKIVKRNSEVVHDLAQAWCLREMVSRITGVEDTGLQGLTERMTVADKRVWLTRQLRRGRKDEDNIAFVECCRTGDQFEELHSQYQNQTGLGSIDICSEFEVRFRDENSVGSAVVREWMEIVASSYRQSQHLIGHPENGCFLIAPDTIFRNTWWSVDFEMLGRMIGLAFLHQVTLDLPLDPSVWSLILQPYDTNRCFKDEIDSETKIHPDFVRLFPNCAKNNVKWLLHNSVGDMGVDLTFTDVLSSSMEENYNLEPVTVTKEDILPEYNPDESVEAPASETEGKPPPLSFSLVSGGEDVAVTDDNKDDYIVSLQEWRLCESINRQVASLKKGLSQVIPQHLFADIGRILTPAELGLLLSGMQAIDLDDWKAHCNYVGFPEGSETDVIKWFWEVLEGWKNDNNTDQLQSTLQFATGSRRVPVGGFACLVGHNGGQHQFTLSNAKHMSSTSLPRAQACICTIDLPPWESRDVAVEKLTLALDNRNLRFEEGFN